MRGIRNTLRRTCELFRSQLGMSTAEYAVGTVAACGFAALLYKILTSDSVLHMVSDIIYRALHLGF